MKERAETYSEKIINVSPEGIVTVGKKLKVKQINKAACKIFGIKDPADIIGYPVSRIMDEYDFVKMISQDETQVTDEVFLADYNVYLERIFICDPERTLFTCIMRDVTKARQRRNKIQKTKIHAADLADDIIANQLRIVHEIASLLGETAAETKVAVHDLKEASCLMRTAMMMRKRTNRCRNTVWDISVISRNKNGETLCGDSVRSNGTTMTRQSSSPTVSAAASRPTSSPR